MRLFGREFPLSVCLGTFDSAKKHPEKQPRKPEGSQAEISNGVEQTEVEIALRKVCSNEACAIFIISLTRQQLEANRKESLASRKGKSKTKSEDTKDGTSAATEGTLFKKESECGHVSGNVLPCAVK